MTIKHIELTHNEWQLLRERLVAEYGTKILFSWVSRRELGFTMRDHQRSDESRPTWADKRSVICLDFYDEDMKAWFMLKYA